MSEVTDIRSAIIGNYIANRQKELADLNPDGLSRALILSQLLLTIIKDRYDLSDELNGYIEDIASFDAKIKELTGR